MGLFCNHKCATKDEIEKIAREAANKVVADLKVRVDDLAKNVEHNLSYFAADRQAQDASDKVYARLADPFRPPEWFIRYVVKQINELQVQASDLKKGPK